VVAAKQDILQGWKDIAVYLDRNVRTVYRWEKYRGLPVHRMPGDGRANVYALPSELDRWLVQTPPPDLNSVDATSSRPIPNFPLAPTPAFRARWMISATLGLAAIVVLVAITRDLRANRRTHAAVVAPAPAHPASRVPGVEDLYLRAVYAYGKRTPASLALADQDLKQALTKDPNDAAAWSALAITHNLMRQYGAMPSELAFEDARRESQRAITLDPNLSDAHASLAFVQFFWDSNSSSADREFHTAIALNPNSALAHQWYGSMLFHEGQLPLATEQLDLAQRLDPTSTSILSLRALVLGFSGHRAQAFDLLQQITSQDPNYAAAHSYLSMLSLLPPQEIPRYLIERRTYAQLTHHPEDVALIDAMARAYGPPNHTDAAAMWRLVLQTEKANHPGESTLHMAQAEAELGDNDAAFADLQDLSQHHSSELLGIVFWPEFIPLRPDPRFNRLVSSTGLPPLP
jgi:Tfp pilus assembly protein PilF